MTLSVCGNMSLSLRQYSKLYPPCSLTALFNLPMYSIYSETLSSLCVHLPIHCISTFCHPLWLPPVLSRSTLVVCSLLLRSHTISTPSSMTSLHSQIRSSCFQLSSTLSLSILSSTQPSILWCHQGSIYCRRQVNSKACLYDLHCSQSLILTHHLL